MLYVTTKSNFYSETAPKALQSDIGADGGLFVPYQMPTFTPEQISEILNKGFCDGIADVLNLFFSCKLDCTDVENAIGKFPIELVKMNHRIVIAEAWRNADSDFESILNSLSNLVCDKLNTNRNRSSWLCIAVRVSVIFGLFGQLIRDGLVSNEQKMDIAVPTGDFSTGFSFWLCRDLGLPIANIICSCNENSAAWDLFHQGQLYTNASLVETTTPLCDIVVPREFERLVYAKLGSQEVSAYLNAVSAGHVYRPSEENAASLRKGIFSAVVSRSRLDALIPSVYRTNSYVLGPYTALAYGGLMDYRAKTGESRTTLIFAERSPLLDAKIVADSMQISVPELQFKVK